MGSREEMHHKEGCQKLETTNKARDFEFIAYIPREKFRLAPSWIPVNHTQATVNTLNEFRSVSVYWDGKRFIHGHQH